MATLVRTLNETVLANRASELKAFVIFVSDDAKSIEPRLARLAEKTGANDIALAYISQSDRALEAYKITLAPEVKNTVMLYRNKQVTSKFVNLAADGKGIASLKSAIAEMTES